MDRTDVTVPPLDASDRPEFDRIASHVGHEVEVAAYGTPTETLNVAVQCLDCGSIVVDEDRYPDLGGS